MTPWQERVRNVHRLHRWAISNMHGVFCSRCMDPMLERSIFDEHVALCPKAGEPMCPCDGDYCTDPDCDW